MARYFGNDTQESRDANATLAARERDKNKKLKIIEGSIAGVLVFVGICSIFKGMMDQSTVKNDVAQLSQQISSAQADLASRQSEQGSTPTGTVEYVDAIAYTAEDLGKQVCDYQNKMTSIKRERLAAGDTGDYGDAFVELRSNFDKCFQGTLPTALKGVWCDYGVWTFENTYDFEAGATVNGSTKTSVVFRCYDGNQPVAFVTATYDGSLNKFLTPAISRTSNYDDLKANDPLLNKKPSSSSDGNDTSVPSSSSDTEIDVPPEETSSSSSSTPDSSSSVPSSSFSSTSSSSSEIPSDLPPEEKYIYAWSTEYQCYGYFDRDGNFITEDEYNQIYYEYYYRR